MAVKKPKMLTGQHTIDLDKNSPELNEGLDRRLIALDHIVVKDDASYKHAFQFAKEAAERVDAIEAFFDDTRNTAHQLHKSICTKITILTQPWKDIRAAVEVKMKTYLNALEAQQREAERILEQAAANSTKELEREAKALRRQGDISGARQLEAQAAMTLAPTLPDARPEIDGLAVREPWDGECYDLMQLLRAIVEGKIPLNHVVNTVSQGEIELPIVNVDGRVLKHYAKTLQKEFNIPGCRAKKGISLGISR